MDPTNSPQLHETATMRCWLRQDGIIHSQVKKKANITLTDATLNMETMWNAGGNKKRPVFSDISDIGFVDKPSRKYVRANNYKTMLAVAILATNPISMFIGNVFLNFEKPDLPMKIFLGEEDAINWLKKFIHD